MRNVLYAFPEVENYCHVVISVVLFLSPTKLWPTISVLHRLCHSYSRCVLCGLKTNNLFRKFNICEFAYGVFFPVYRPFAFYGEDSKGGFHVRFPQYSSEIFSVFWNAAMSCLTVFLDLSVSGERIIGSILDTPVSLTLDRVCLVVSLKSTTMSILRFKLHSGFFGSHLRRFLIAFDS